MGSVAEEAAKLFGAVAGWAREHGDGLSTTADDAAGDPGETPDAGPHDHAATGGASCTWCPVCRTITAVRQTSPEVRAHLAAAASSLMLAVTEMMSTQPPPRDNGVERIDLDDGDGAWDDDGDDDGAGVDR